MHELDSSNLAGVAGGVSLRSAVAPTDTSSATGVPAGSAPTGESGPIWVPPPPPLR